MTFSISGTRRPKRSAMMPNRTAPTGRIASVAVSASAICGRVVPNDAATSSITRVRTKKSNASKVQPRKPAKTALRWFARSSRDIATDMEPEDIRGRLELRPCAAPALRAAYVDPAVTLRDE
jgi:hypothetical protein